jgi:hypothetical protein
MTNLEEKIYSARTKMHELWKRKGIIDEEVLAASLEVDKLLNQYQKQFEQKTETAFHKFYSNE